MSKKNKGTKNSIQAEMTQVQPEMRSEENCNRKGEAKNSKSKNCK